MIYLCTASVCIRALVNIILLTVEISADKVLSMDGFTPTFRAAFDSCTHGLIAALSWMLVIEYHHTHQFSFYSLQILTCGFIGTLLDVDHFIEAKSLHLKDALTLTRRPPLHNTSLLLLAWCFIALVAISASSQNLWQFSWLLLVSGLSHHLRDGIRRGLWLYPFGSTSPLPYWFFLSSTAIFPHIVRILMNRIIYQNLKLDIVTV